MLKTMVPREQNEEEECKITDTKIRGNTVTWTMKCSGEDAMEVKGETTYHGDTFDGTITMISNDPEEGKMKMINHKRNNVEATIFQLSFFLRNNKSRYRGQFKHQTWAYARCLWLNLAGLTTL